MTHKRFIAALILVLAVIGSLSDGYAEDTKPRSAETDSLKDVSPDSTVGLEWYKVDSLSVYAVEAESLTVVDGILIECANQANWPSSGGVLEEK